MGAGYVKGAAGPDGFAEIENPELRLIFGKDVVVHREQLGDMQAGTAVNFAVLLNEESMPQAFDLQVGHAGASKPAPVNASHLAAAQLLQGGAGAAKARKDMVDADMSAGKGGSFGDGGGFQMDWMQKGKGDDKGGNGGKGGKPDFFPGKGDIQQGMGQFKGNDPQSQWGGCDPQNQWNQGGWNKGQWN